MRRFVLSIVALLALTGCETSPQILATPTSAVYLPIAQANVPQTTVPNNPAQNQPTQQVYGPLAQENAAQTVIPSTQLASPQAPVSSSPAPQAPPTEQVYLPLTQGGSGAVPTPPPAGTRLPNAPPVYGYRVLNTYPHDPQAYTQGLVYADGVLYESTGLYGKSGIRRVELTTGMVQAQTLITDTSAFGEGLVLFQDRFYQLTWQSRRGYIYDRNLQSLGTFSYDTEGWGITSDGSRLLMSDGTATIYAFDPQTSTQTPLFQVTDENGPVIKLNELEYIDGALYANIWMTDRIAKIDPQTGKVLAYIDLTGLIDPAQRSSNEAVLNGIAYDATNKRLFVTGKLWPSLFEIAIVQ